MQKKSTAILALLVCMVFTVTACGSPASVSNGNTSSDAATAAGSETTSAGKTIRVLSFSGSLADAIDPMAKTYEENTGVKVEIVKLDYDSVYDKALSLTKAKSSDFDVYLLDDSWITALIMDGHLTELDTQFGYQTDDDIFKPCSDVGTWPTPYGAVPPSEKGKTPHIYGVPVVGDILLFGIRNDVLKEKGLEIPKSINDVVKDAKACYDKSKPFWGFVNRGQKSNPAAADFLPVLYSMGGDFVDENWNVTLDNDTGHKAVNTFLELCKYGPTGMASYNTSELGLEFVSGRALCSYMWPGDLSKDLENPELSKSAGKLTWMVPPTGIEGQEGKTLLGIWLMSVPVYSKNQQEAYDFVKWFSAPEQAMEYAKLGGMSVRKSVLTDAALAAEHPWYTAQAAAFEQGIWRTRTPKYFQMEEIFGTYLNQAIAGQISGDEVVEKSADEIRTILKEAGYTN
jgi:multiple sugar transport system substrate-binding protein